MKHQTHLVALFMMYLMKRVRRLHMPRSKCLRTHKRGRAILVAAFYQPNVCSFQRRAEDFHTSFAQKCPFRGCAPQIWSKLWRLTACWPNYGSEPPKMCDVLSRAAAKRTGPLPVWNLHKTTLAVLAVPFKSPLPV